MTERRQYPVSVDYLSELPRDLALLQIRDETGALYSALYRPSPELARAAIWDAMLAHAEKWRGVSSARGGPKLVIEIEIATE